VNAEDFDALSGAMAEWAADQRADHAARARSRVDWLRRQAAEAATLAGVLIDLAERAAPVRLETQAGPHDGRVEVVTTGLCALRRRDGSVTLVALSAVTALHSSDALATGDRAPAIELDMAGALCALCADRSAVTIAVVGGSQVVGALETVGTELVSVKGDRGLVLVVLDAVTACSF
jgi:hypothetical protein